MLAYEVGSALGHQAPRRVAGSGLHPGLGLRSVYGDDGLPRRCQLIRRPSLCGRSRINLISVAFAVLFVGLAEDFVIHFDCGARGIDSTGSIRSARCCRWRWFGVAVPGGDRDRIPAFVPTEYVGPAELGDRQHGHGDRPGGHADLMPALLSLRPCRNGAADLEAAVTAESGLRHHAGLIVVLAGVAALLAALPLGRLQFDPDTFNLKDPGTESVTTLLELVSEGDVAAYPIDFAVKGEAAARELAAKAAADPSVAKVTTIETYVPGDQEEKLAIIGDMALFLDPILRTAAAPPPAPADMRREIQTADKTDRCRRRRLRRQGAGLPLAEDLTKLSALTDDGAPRMPTSSVSPLFLEQLDRAMLAAPVSLDKLPPLLSRNWVTPDGFYRVEAVAKGDRGTGTVDVPAFVDRMQAIDPAATGPAIANVGAGRAVTDAMVKATIYAIFAITVLLLLVLRDVVDTALTILPLILSGLLTASTRCWASP
jgi:hypothetical protein